MMVARNKLTRLARIGISHGENAKSLAAKGMYSEALSELKVALFSLRSENTDGRLNGEIAGILHSIGTLNLMLSKYADAQAAFLDAVAIRRPMTASPDIAGSLIGLSDAYRGLCDFERSEETLHDALQIALARKNDQMASRIIAMLDQLERTRDNLPAGEIAGPDDYYVPGAFSSLQGVLRNIELEIGEKGVSLGLVIGFPGVDASLLSACRDHQPGIGVLFSGKQGSVSHCDVIDEEETEICPIIEPFDGIMFAPDSYHKHGPLPVPPCKKFTFATGKGSLVKWELSSNGWYRADMKVDLPAFEEGFRLMLALPFYLRLQQVTVDVKKPLEYGMLCIEEGTYHVTRNPERVRSGHNLPYAFKRRLFYGSAFGLIDIKADSTLKYAVVSFELSRQG